MSYFFYQNQLHNQLQSQLFLAITPRVHCDTNVFLSEPAVVFDDPPTKVQRIEESNSTTDPLVVSNAIKQKLE